MREAPLLVRLPNHLGDTLMTLPALTRLAAAGRDLVLVGRAWTQPLLAAHPWPVHAAAAALPAAVAQWRRLRAAAGTRGALLFTNSFGTALRARLGGLAPVGYATDARRWLLARALPVPARWRDRRMHLVEYYDALAGAVLGQLERRVPPLALRLTPQAQAAARDLLAQAGVGSAYVVLCPGATGLHHGRAKAWPHFAPLTRWLLARGVTVAAVPGPGEHASFVAALPGATVLPATDVATFGAVLAASRLVVANDSGPSHLAAAVGAPLITLFGVTEPERTRPWSERARVLGSDAGWPGFDEVGAAAAAALDAAGPAAP